MSHQAPPTPPPDLELSEPLPVEALRWRCDPARFDFETTAHVEPEQGVVGQDDAVEALRFGLGIRAPGQNVFVRGLTGTGRSTLLQRLLRTIPPSLPRPADRCYVYNFAQPDRPRLLTLPRGQGEAFRRRIDAFIKFMKDEFAQGLSSDVVKARGSDIERRAGEDMKKTAKPFEEELRTAGLTMVMVQVGPVSRQVIAPLFEGQPASQDKLEALRQEGKLTEAQIEQMRARVTEFSARMQKIGERMQEIQLKRVEALNEVLHEEAHAILEGVLQGVRREFPGPDVRAFLDAVVDDVLTRRLGELAEGTDFTERYRVNVVLKHDAEGAVPVVLEHAPSVQALLGTIDRSLNPEQDVYAPQMMIRGGSLLRADGGYLILEGRDVLSEPGAWKVLIRTLRSGCIELVPPDLPVPWQVPALKPEPIRVSVKVVLLGNAELYYMLDALDSDFRDHFKVLSDFDTTIPRDTDGLNHYAGVIARIVQEENLPPFDRAAVAYLCEHGASIAASPEKLTGRFGRLADLAREAAWLAVQAGQAPVSVDHLRHAVRRTKRRADLPARRYREMIARRTIRVETCGSAVGQVNGLAVMHAGPLTYGFPTRITATIGPGSAGTINIEREAELSGSIHTKGFYILGGLLRYLLRTAHPLTFSASIAFEQSYGGIDGDSASAAEMCCLLSALTDTPIRQDLAMTGAIDQVGNILPIGAVNEKIEGFYDACLDVCLTGTQGVIIPQSNVGDLMLREDVVEACRDGRFRVFPVATIQQALAHFSGLAAGVRDADGDYPAASMLGLAVLRARAYWEMVVAMDAGAPTEAGEEEADEEEAGEEEAEEQESGLPPGPGLAS